jgi:hypothetical protein
MLLFLRRRRWKRTAKGRRNKGLEVFNIAIVLVAAVLLGDVREQVSWTSLNIEGDLPNDGWRAGHLAVSREGGFAVIIIDGGKARVVDCANGRITKTIDLETSVIRHTAFLDEDRFAVSTKDGLRVMSIASGRVQMKFNHSVFRFAVNSRSVAICDLRLPESVFSGGKPEDRLALIDLNCGKQLHLFPNEVLNVNDLTWDASETRFACAAWGDVLLLGDGLTRSIRELVKVSEETPYSLVSFDPSGTKLLACWDRRFVLIDLHEEKRQSRSWNGEPAWPSQRFDEKRVDSGILSIGFADRNRVWVGTRSGIDMLSWRELKNLGTFSVPNLKGKLIDWKASPTSDTFVGLTEKGQVHIGRRKAVPKAN